MERGSTSLSYVESNLDSKSELQATAGYGGQSRIQQQPKDQTWRQGRTLNTAFVGLMVAFVIFLDANSYCHQNFLANISAGRQRKTKEKSGTRNDNSTKILWSVVWPGWFPNDAFTPIQRTLVEPWDICNASHLTVTVTLPEHVFDRLVSLSPIERGGGHVWSQPSIDDRNKPLLLQNWVSHHKLKITLHIVCISI